MAGTINWLHLTDLHLGLDDQSWLWPKVKHLVLKDIADQQARLGGGGWDIVFFTGDLVQKGDAREYEKINEFLQLLWESLKKNGSEPKLCVVPGNHDLVRPDDKTLTTKALSRHWWSDSQQRIDFWRDENHECRKAVNSCFANYVNWLANIPVPTLMETKGILPGDFSSTFSKNSEQIGIIGLNTTFLQVVKGDFQGKLDMHVSQLNAVCGNEPDNWLSKRRLNILLTHQPFNWLSEAAIQHFRKEIYTPGRFYVQLCGHQHEPLSSELSEFGDSPRRLRVGASLFGLEKWDDVDPKQRIHGYSAGQFIFEGNKGKEKVYPRILVRGGSGADRIVPDHQYVLQEESYFITQLPSWNQGNIDDTKEIDEQFILSNAEQSENNFRLLDAPPDLVTSQKLLQGCPRLNLKATPEHQKVRQEEQEYFIATFKRDRCIWLVADWGTGKNGFLAVCLEKAFGKVEPLNIFQLDCDSATNIEELEVVFQQYFARPIQSFCSLASQLNNAVLIFDNIHPSLATGDNLSAIKRIATAIHDYSENLYFILHCRLKPASEIFDVIKIGPLDIPDTRVYLNTHPDYHGRAIFDGDTVEKIHERSEGLTMHIDKFLQTLKVGSLSDALDDDVTKSDVRLDTDETPISLIHAVQSLSASVDPLKQRSYKLLKVLSMLPYGETLETLKHYIPTQPFFDNNAIQLQTNALVDVIPVYHSIPSIGKSSMAQAEFTSPKILKVPRQVRDYVSSQMTESEREEIILSGIERYFGKKWRDGVIKFRSIPLEYREYLTCGAGNEYVLIHALMSSAISKDDQDRIDLSIKLAECYAQKLLLDDRYRDLVFVTNAFVKLIDRNERPKQWAEMAFFYGKGLRMLGKRDEALRYFHEAKEIGFEHFSPELLSKVWLGIAMAEDSNRNKESAIQAAKQVQALTDKTSSTYLSAQLVIIENSLQGQALIAELKKMAKIAHSKGHTTISQNIAIGLAKLSSNDSSKIKHYESVLNDNEPGYNSARAIIGKVQTLLHIGTYFVDNIDLIRLERAYSYLHGQRFSSLFDECHETLWKTLEYIKNNDKLLRLFRHSSLVWRIRGQDSKEAEYIERLQNFKEDILHQVNSVPVEKKYYLLRLTFYVSSALGISK